MTILLQPDFWPLLSTETNLVEIPHDLLIAKSDVLFFIFIFPNTSLTHDSVDTFFLLEIPLMASYEQYAYSFSILFSASHQCT